MPSGVFGMPLRAWKSQFAFTTVTNPAPASHSRRASRNWRPSENPTDGPFRINFELSSQFQFGKCSVS